jgi:kynurenine formamidase
MYKYVDLSHIVEHGTVTYKGLPGPMISDHMSREASRKNYAEGTEFQIGKIEMVTNTGTYIDFPFHRYAQGEDPSSVDLSRLVDLPAITIRAPFEKNRAIDKSYFEGLPVSGKAVLVDTGWSRHWGTPAYYENNPFLTRDAAEYLAVNQTVLVGIDSHNIDSVADGTRPVHTILLGKGILIVEHLCNLNELPDRDYSFSAVPPKFKGIGTFPVRAYARIPSSQTPI